jgi:type IV pilus assembly protein PilC
VYSKTALHSYTYTAINKNGERIHGSENSACKPALYSRLEMQSLYVIRIKKKKNTHNKMKRIKPCEIEAWLHKFEQSLNANITILQSLELLLMRETHTGLKDITTTILNDIASGNPLSSSLEKHPSYFSPTAISFVKAGEASGDLCCALHKLNAFLEQKRALKRILKKALTYPCTVLGIAILITTGLLLFVIPQFEKIYESMGGALPYPTQLLITASGYVLPFLGTLSSLVFIGISSAQYLFKKSTRCRNRWHALQLKIPILNHLLIKNALIGWCQLCASLLAAGLPLNETLNLSADAIHSTYIRQQLKQSHSKICQGSNFSQALSDTILFDKADLQLITLAEHTGTLDQMIKHIGTLHNKVFREKIEHACQLLEPLLMLVLAIIIGGLVLVMYLPVFQLGNVL